MPEFIVKLGDKTLLTKKLEGELLRIGRSRENDVVLENLSVSREHAQVRFHENQYSIVDLNSANGTLVNGVKTSKADIVDGDVITIGKHKLYFQNPPDEDAETAEAFSDDLHTVMMEPKPEAWLSVESGRLQGREFRITRFETSLGKAPTNDIVLTDDWLLGKKQAIILRKGNDQYEIQYLGGLRGIKVNNTAVADKAFIKDGDSIEMGATKLTFHSTPGPASKGGNSRKSEEGFGTMKAGLLAARRPEQPLESMNDESLDLEEGFQSVRITMNSHLDKPAEGEVVAVADGQPPSASSEEPTPAAGAVVQDELPAEKVPAEAVAEPVGAVGGASHSASGPSDRNSKPFPYPQPDSRNNNGRNRNTVFEDQRSTTRRKRKHHKRANAQQSASQIVEPVEKQKQYVSAKGKLKGHSEVSPEKEIAMWEAALQNPSPAIKRQAAKMLKKLTGRDYDV